MNDKKKTSSFGGIIGFIILISIFTNVFKGGSSVIIPFVIMIVGITLFGYLIRKANTHANKNNSTQDRPDIFEEKERSYQNNKYTHSKTNKRETKHYQSAKHDYSHRCPKCKTLISSKDKICPECGTVQKNTVRCKTCGHDNPTGNVVCENCNDFLY